MTNEPVELFYSYAHRDEALRNKLEDHLSLLRREGYISEWHDRKITAGSLWGQEIDKHLKAARIILLLVTSSFLASDYCYGTEMQEAMRKHEAGEARVIPIILRACDWKTAPFGTLEALPKNAKPVVTWTDRDTAFTDIARGIRTVVDEVNGKVSMTPSEEKPTSKKKWASGEEVRKPHMLSAPTLNTAVLKKTIANYYKELEDYKSKATSELSLRNAFQSLLADMARHVKWTLVAEQTIEKGIRPDGVVRDDYFARGYWEAKGPKGNLGQEIAKKISQGYPLTNTIFENTQEAVLYQNEKLFAKYDLRKANDVSDLISQFFTYTEPDIDNFETAVQEFKERIPELAKAVLTIIEREYKTNKRFITAFDTFAELCRTSLDPKITTNVLNEMLIQHLLTERLFRTIFDNTDFVRRNVIASEIEKVIDALASRSFNRNDFLKSLDRFYVAIEVAAKGIRNWSEQQHFLNTVYERFFQGYSVKRADTFGIVYTPQEIVDFMCASVEEVLQREFGKSISEPGVQILDPATGTGSFIVNLVHRIPRRSLKYKYQHDLFCNEIMLLPYYIASLNIEHEYYAKMGEYEAFEGVCFVDTLDLAEGQQLPLFVEENTERVQREKDAQIMVVIGNPPYNVGQKSENDNNKNRQYDVIDQRVKDTYVKDSEATLRNQLYDAYVRFFRWATDRLQGRDGIVCYVSNNSFVSKIAFDGMRKHLMKDFTEIYHLDLHGDVRNNPKLSGTIHNVFGIQVGVGITIATRISNHTQRKIYYYRVPEYWRKSEKLRFLAEKGDITKVEWEELQPTQRYTWLTQGLYKEFPTFFPLGGKNADSMGTKTLAKTYAVGVHTSRDSTVYDFNLQRLENRIKQFIDDYNAEVFRWKSSARPQDIDSFVHYDKVKWSEHLKRELKREKYGELNNKSFLLSLYRPFCKKWLYYNSLLCDRPSSFNRIFPIPAAQTENIVICIPGLGNRKDFGCLATNCIPSMDLAFEKVRAFPFYTYSEDGTYRSDNITDWALSQFQIKYSSEVTRWNIFHYVYTILHHPQYRERYTEDLKSDFPHIPLLRTKEAFDLCVQIGKRLMYMHVNYQQVKEYKLEWLEKEGIPFSSTVEKMHLSTDKRVVVVNNSLRLGPLPSECLHYRLGNLSALEWVIDQYQVTKDPRSGIENDPNNIDDPEYIVHLIEKVVTVSVETVRLVNELAQAVKMEDWMDETVKLDEAEV